MFQSPRHGPVSARRISARWSWSPSGVQAIIRIPGRSMDGIMARIRDLPGVIRALAAPVVGSATEPRVAEATTGEAA